MHSIASKTCFIFFLRSSWFLFCLHLNSVTYSFHFHAFFHILFSIIYSQYIFPYYIVFTHLFHKCTSEKKRDATNRKFQLVKKLMSWTRNLLEFNECLVEKWNWILSETAIGCSHYSLLNNQFKCVLTGKVIFC